MIDWTSLLGAKKPQAQIKALGHVFNPQAGLGEQQAPPAKTPWLNREGMGGLTKGELLLAGMGMLSGRNLQEGFGNSAQIAYGGMERKRKEQEKQEKSAALTKALTMMQTGDKMGAQTALTGMYPDAVGSSLAEQAFAPPEQTKYGLDLKEVIGPDGKPMLVQASEAGGYKQLEGVSPVPDVDQRPWWAKEDGSIDPAQAANQAAGRSPGTTVNVGGLGGGAKSLAEIPLGQPVPEDLLGGIKLPDDIYAVRADNPAGFAFAVIPGSESDRKSQAGGQAKEGRSYTLGTLIGSYATLAKNKAITSQGNSAAENAAALYSGTGVGQMQDKLGGEVGNLDNAEARDTIQGLSMKSLMDMISMSEVSSKAMDSDAEMKAWLTAVKSDNYESALTKLHVLDMSFGSGQELQRAYESGVIDLATYQHVTNRVNTDPEVKKMLDKANRYAALGEAVGEENMTESERSELEQLRAWKAQQGIQ